jgi:hypothetical protein
LDDLGFSKLERVTVAVIEDHVRWNCRANLLHDETPRRNVARCE